MAQSQSQSSNPKHRIIPILNLFSLVEQFYPSRLLDARSLALSTRGKLLDLLPRPIPNFLKLDEDYIYLFNDNIDELYDSLEVSIVNILNDLIYLKGRDNIYLMNYVNIIQKLNRLINTIDSIFFHITDGETIVDDIDIDIDIDIDF